VDEDYSMVTDSTLYRFINEAQVQTCRRMDLIFDDTVPSVCSITLVAGTRSYKLNRFITRLEHVSYDGTELVKKTPEELDVSDPTWRTLTGVPTMYVVRQRKIYPVPAPTADEVAIPLALEVYRLPRFDIDCDDELEIPLEFQDDLIPWVLYRVYHKRDEDIFDPDKGKMHLAEFIETFGEVVPADVRLYQFENPKKATIRPSTGYAMTNSLSMGEEALEDDDW